MPPELSDANVKLAHCSIVPVKNSLGAWFVLGSNLLISGPGKNGMFQPILYRVAGLKSPYANWKVDPDSF